MISARTLTGTRWSLRSTSPVEHADAQPIPPGSSIRVVLTADAGAPSLRGLLKHGEPVDESKEEMLIVKDRHAATEDPCHVCR